MVADWGSADMSRVLPQHSGSCRSAWVPVGGRSSPTGRTNCGHYNCQFHNTKNTISHAFAQNKMPYIQNGGVGFVPL